MYVAILSERGGRLSKIQQRLGPVKDNVAWSCLELWYEDGGKAVGQTDTHGGQVGDQSGQHLPDRGKDKFSHWTG